MKIKAYVDGSYRNGKVGWGAVILKGDTLYGEFSGVLNDDEVQGTRQVAGELMAVREVLFWCKENKVTELSIHFDYKGIEEWVTGGWKAKKAITQEYRDYVRSSGIKITWVKVKSHSGDYYNNMADRLASTMLD